MTDYRSLNAGRYLHNWPAKERSVSFFCKIFQKNARGKRQLTNLYQHETQRAPLIRNTSHENKYWPAKSFPRLCT